MRRRVNDKHRNMKHLATDTSTNKTNILSLHYHDCMMMVYHKIFCLTLENSPNVVFDLILLLLNRQYDYFKKTHICDAFVPVQRNLLILMKKL